MVRFRSLSIVLASLLLLACAKAAFSQQATLELTESTTVPFKLAGNHIFVRASVNGKPYAFVFDTGGAASVSLEAAKALALPIIGKQQVHGVGEAVANLEIASIGDVRIGKAVYRGGSFLVLPAGFGLTSPFSDIAFGGILGREFFGTIVTIDYGRSMLTFAPRTGFVPPAGDVKLPMTMRQGIFPNVTASLNGHSGAFDIDAGAIAAVTVTGTFADSANLPRDLGHTVDMEVGRGVGGPIRGTVGRAHDLTLASIQIPNPIIVVTRAQGGVFAGSDLAGNIGGETLRRFTVTLDVAGDALYLRPNASFADAFAFNRAGLTVTRDGGTIKVHEIIAGSPAADGGVRAGDLIEQIDGKLAAGMTIDQIHAGWMRPVGTTVAIVVSREGKPRTVDLVLRDLI